MTGRELAHRFVQRAARRYVAGAGLDDALAAAARLGRPVTLAYWDGAADDAGAVAERYVEAFEALAAVGGDGYVSIKLPALAGEQARLDAVASAARRTGLLLHFDSLAEDAADETLELATALAATQPVGVTLPGAWSRSVADAAPLAEAGVRVRVVKGQWPGDSDPRDGFLAIVRRLAEHRVQIAVATHDAPLAAAALGLCGALSPELELLYGLPTREPAAAAARHGAPLRIYVPYGSAYVPYALRRLRRQPRMLWWLARDALRR